VVIAGGLVVSAPDVGPPTRPPPGFGGAWLGGHGLVEGDGGGLAGGAVGHRDAGAVVAGSGAGQEGLAIGRRWRIAGLGRGGHDAGCGRGGHDAGLAQLGQAEVEHLDRVVVGDHDVGGLDVAVKDALGVGGGQGVGDGDEGVEGLARRHGALGPDALAQGPALDQLHDQEVLAVLGQDVEQGDHARVRDRGRGPGLAQHAGAALRVVGQGAGQKLDGDVAVEALVAGAPDLAHGAFAEAGQQAVGPDELPGGGHGGIVAGFARPHPVPRFAGEGLSVAFGATGPAWTG
jgi:hypothetical protein